MDFVFHNGTNGSSPYVEFYPYNPSAPAGYAFMAIFGVLTIVHFVLMFPFRAAYFIPLVLGGICETFGYYGRAWSHNNRTKIGSWALQEMLILCAPALVAATIYMTLARVIRACDAEHMSSIRTKWLTFIFVLNDIICFCTQIGGAGVQITGDAKVMSIGRHVVLGGLIFSLVIFGLFVLVALKFHRRLAASPTNIVIQTPEVSWKRYMWVMYAACLALSIRNLFRTIQFGTAKGISSGQKKDPLGQYEVFIYVFDAFLMVIVILTLSIYHPGLLIKKWRWSSRSGDFMKYGRMESNEISETLALTSR
ncbi:RTA1 like protein-domain-containing protein [Talaromyces proteolyticus]|uniref:RTA1 like protein-domain-containing protein n=1 Tax=Talaromyces proteolyticus TaxID=1131652 RepID=A0AAD4KUZ7_9EURO|nr:RTA1 like protein-domain-containing protein [Talaromyces proteolyticus]KAH8698919.1 RTA1 like protein-domain-containing protein [Talaromyces proteolyticus]